MSLETAVVVNNINEKKEVTVIQTLIILSAMFTSLIAILVGVHSLFFDDGSVIWNASKFFICIILMTVGILTLLQIRSRVSGHAVEAMLLAGSLAVIVIGAAGVPWTLFLAHKTGDFEWWVIFVDFVMIVQGVLTAFYLWIRANNRLMKAIR